MATDASSPKRLYMQFLALTGCFDVKPLLTPLGIRKLDCVLYKDANDPMGIGLLTLADDPEVFVTELREMLCARPFQTLTIRSEYSMLGPAFSRDADESDDAVIDHGRNTVMNRQWPWAVWYRIRRSPAFYGLDAGEQGRLLAEIEAMPEGTADDAGKVSLRCHGLEANDTDIFVGLAGRELEQLSSMIERKRQTEHFRTYVDSLGPFFVGRAVWQGEAVELHSARW